MMSAMPPSVPCPQCGQVNSSVASTCIVCGAALAVPGMLGDPQANIVAGAPVPADQRERPEAASERLARIGPEIATIVSEAITQHATDFSDRIARRSTEIGDRISRHSMYAGDRMSRRTAKLADRLERRSLRLSDRLARHELRRQHMLEVVQRVRDLALPPPHPYPVPYAPSRADVPIPARAAWFLLAGSWLACWWVIATWLVLNLVVFGAQANRMITMIPNVLTLRTAGHPPSSIVPSPRTAVSGLDGGARVAYWLLFGWWASLVWMIVAYGISMTGVGIPIGYRMFSVTPRIAHL
jgi:hypothetical protein